MNIEQNSSNALSIQTSKVQLATVLRGDLTRDVAANGRIVAANAPQVYSPEQGYVDLLVQPGDKVSLGQVIAQVSSPELNNKLKQQESVLQRLSGELERQKLDARRQSLALTKNPRFSTSGIDRSRSRKSSRPFIDC